MAPALLPTSTSLNVMPVEIQEVKDRIADDVELVLEE